MRWPSPWSDGFPGWHLECSAMSAKYLGEHFDIHGGGMDLIFPHHESEIAQSQAANNIDPCNYWLHNNMITINGQKMGKSLGNFITLNEFFNGGNPTLTQNYSPMTIRFFILQAHYGSTLDFSNEALQAAEKGLKRLMTGYKTLLKIKASDKSSEEISKFITELKKNCYEAMNDDFNSPIVISALFEAVKWINLLKEGKEKISEVDHKEFSSVFNSFLIDILGLKDDSGSQDEKITDELMKLIISLRQDARANRDFATSDKIRDELQKINISIKDGKEGTEWSAE
jgi:cysteinyl-tRNA synthetase